MTRRRRAAAALVAAAFLLAACSTEQTGDAGSSSAGCYGPWLDTEAVGEPPDSSSPDPVATVRPGETHTFYGHGYTSTCNDTGTRANDRPLGPVQLTADLPGGRRIQLDEFTPRVDNTDTGFVASVTVPLDTPAGTAVVSDGLSPATTYRFDVED
jgi:hypothetical protein